MSAALAVSPSIDVAPTPAVAVRGVDKTYGTVRAVAEASFDLATGRFLTILGPSGSGKTTLLRLIAGFERPTTGEIRIGGVPVDRTPPHKRSIGMVFQRLALFPHLTAAENVAFPLRMRRFDARTIPERVERYLDLVRLGGLGGRRIQQLSGGQQQRVAIARALVFEPDLLLLDEPLAALDRKLREEMQLEFRRIQRELGVTTINVTHDQREALVVSDDVIVMEGGRIQQWAEPGTTYRRPANAFVASFIGVTNVLEGRATAMDGDRVTFGDDAAGPLTGVWNDADPVAIGAPVSAALRAEQVRMAANAEALGPLDTIRTGTVRDTIFEGERVVYEIAPDGMVLETLRVFDHDPAAHDPFRIGDAVTLGWNARDVLVFPG
ncbi:MAG: ABC transporter ATP-binding protein [Pseudomonadota bacterium]